MSSSYIALLLGIPLECCDVMEAFDTAASWEGFGVPCTKMIGNISRM